MPVRCRHATRGFRDRGGGRRRSAPPRRLFRLDRRALLSWPAGGVGAARPVGASDRRDRSARAGPGTACAVGGRRRAAGGDARGQLDVSRGARGSHPGGARLPGGPGRDAPRLVLRRLHGGPRAEDLRDPGARFGHCGRAGDRAGGRPGVHVGPAAIGVGRSGLTAVELIEHDGRAAGPLALLVHGLYAEEYPPGPEPAEWRDGLWARHRARDGFRLIVARERGRAVGLAWGYVGSRGEYWSDEVAARLPPETADAWVGGHFEVVEVLVRPEFRRRGVATALLRALLSDAPADRAMLTVRDTAAAARRWYESTGWTELGRWEPG
ncbi:hypothetical protein DOE76_09155 [Leifsonia sp. ku-ls]|nr:hypothetical protein DOE76_09155 [Leifsonia sp. ku-ls]